jgi:hypothetical protein
LKILLDFLRGDAVYFSEITDVGKISFLETIDQSLRMGTVVTFYQTVRLHLAKLGVSTLAVDMIYLTAIGLTPGGSSTVHIYTQTIHRTTKKKKKST